MRQVRNLKSVAISFLTTALFIGGIQTAIAADILVPAPIPSGAPAAAEEDIIVPAPIPIEQTMRYYLRGDIGWSHSVSGDAVFTADTTATSSSNITDTTIIGAGAGIYFSPRLRGDITVDYRTKSDIDTGITGVFNGSLVNGTEFDTIDLNTVLIMVNGYYDFRRPDARITPYIGAGIGIAIHTLDGQPGAPFIGVSNNQDTQLAIAAMAGASLDLRKGWKLDTHYRYLYMGDASMNTQVESAIAGAPPIDGDLKIKDIQAHEVRVGLRYEIY